MDRTFWGFNICVSKQSLERLFHDILKKIIRRDERVGYHMDIMRQTVYPIKTQSRSIAMLPSFTAQQWISPENE